MQNVSLVQDTAEKKSDEPPDGVGGDSTDHAEPFHSSARGLSTWLVSLLPTAMQKEDPTHEVDHKVLSARRH